MRSSNETSNKIWRTISSDYSDKQMTCVDCGSPFTFTAREQEFFASKGYTNEPRDAFPAARTENLSAAEVMAEAPDRDRCSQQHALAAARTAKFRSNPGRATGLLQRMFQCNESHQLISSKNNKLTILTTPLNKHSVDIPGEWYVVSVTEVIQRQSSNRFLRVILKR